MKFSKSRKKLLFIAAIIAFESAVYVITQRIASTPSLVNLPIDDMIPFVPFFSLFYISWFLYLPAVPFYISLKDEEVFAKMIVTWFVMSVVAGLVFVFYPTYMIRPPVESDGFFSGIVYLLYYIDGTVNCMPSMHVATAWLGFVAVRNSDKISVFAKAAVFTWQALICASTVLIKQHWFIDVPTGILLTELCWLVVKKTKLYTKFRI